MRDASDGVFQAPHVSMPPKRPVTGLAQAALLSEDDIVGKFSTYGVNGAEG
jgi:hypothetical protein